MVVNTMKIGDFEIVVRNPITDYQTLLPEFTITIMNKDKVIATQSYKGRNKRSALESMLREVLDVCTEDWLINDFCGDIVKKDNNTYSNPEGIDWFVRIKGTNFFKRFIGRPQSMVGLT